MPAMVRKEAMFPKNAVPLFNRYGIALGFYIAVEARLAVFLPGVPSELEKMYEERVRPLLKQHFKTRRKLALIVKNIGISEPDVMKKLRNDFFNDVFDFGIYPETGEVSLRLYSESPAVIERLRRKIKKRLAGYTYAYEETSLSQAVGKMLAKKKLTLAAAESCTGGLLASEITRIPRSSRYFKGGVVAYGNDIKTGWLDVPPKILLQKGAVSAETAAMLAANIRKKMNAALGISVTGIAGPDGGSKQKPVGQVYMAIADKKKTRVWKEYFMGDRRQIQDKTVKKCLEYLWRYLSKVS